MQTPAEPVMAALKSICVASPTRENAARLWRFYDRAYRGDQDLFARTCDPTAGIDGLTEPQTVDGILAYMQMRDTVTLEHHATDSDECHGFIIVRCATEAPDSIEAFERYFLDGVFSRDTLRFRSDENKAEFGNVMDRGCTAYIAEIVSSGASGITLGLVAAAFQEVSRNLLHTSDFAILGKCLNSVRIGRCFNEIGNRPIHKFVSSVGLRPIGCGEQTRQLHIDGQHDLFAKAFPECSAIDNVTASLEFGLYLGTSQIVGEIASKCGGQV